MIEKIENNGKVLAIIIRQEYNNEGINFFTDDKATMQLGMQIQKKGKKSRPHIHKPIKELKNVTSNEFFYVINGKVKVGLYDENEKVKEVILKKGDSIMISSGHSIEHLEDSKIIEVRQGPYRGEEEKTYIE